MRGVNKIILIGNVGQDPEIRSTQGGTLVANFSVACNETWKGNDGNKQERTEWFRVVAWQRLAEIARDYVRKGNPIYIEGRLQSREWTDRDGVKRTAIDVVAGQLVLLPSPRSGDPAGDGGRAAEYPHSHHVQPGPGIAAPAQQQGGGGDDDDIPF